MPRKRFTSEQIIGKLREAEIALAKGKSMPLVCKQIGVTEETDYRWRKEYGSLSVDQAKRLKEVEKENIRLRKLVADTIMGGGSRPGKELTDWPEELLADTSRPVKYQNQPGAITMYTYT